MFELKYYVLHELLAHWTNFLAQCGGEHHNLLLVWCAAKDFLDVSTHI